MLLTLLKMYINKIESLKCMHAQNFRLTLPNWIIFHFKCLLLSKTRYGKKLKESQQHFLSPQLYTEYQHVAVPKINIKKGFLKLRKYPREKNH